MWPLTPALTSTVNTLRHGQNGHNFRDDIFKRISMDGTFLLLLQFLPKCLRDDPIGNTSVLVQVKAWRRKATSHYLNQWWPNSVTHICVTRAQCIKAWIVDYIAYAFTYRHVCMKTLYHFFHIFPLTTHPMPVQLESEITWFIRSRHDRKRATSISGLNTSYGARVILMGWF